MMRRGGKLFSGAARGYAFCAAAGAVLGLLWAFSPGSIAVGMLACAGGWWLNRVVPQPDRRFVLGIYAAGLLLRLFVCLGMDAAAWVMHGRIPFGLSQTPDTAEWVARDVSRAFIGAGDSDYYSERGFQLVQYARGVRTPRTLSAVYQPYGWNGYLYVVGLFHHLFGYSPVSVKFINVWLGALLGPLMYLFLRSWAGVVVARASCGITAFVPSLVIWSATNLKDTAYLVSTVACLMIFERIRGRPLREKPGWIILFSILLAAHVSLRSLIYSVLLAAACVLSWCMTCGWPRRFKLALIGGFLGAAFLLRSKLQAFLALAFFYHVGHILTPGVSYQYLPQRFYDHRSMDAWMQPGALDIGVFLSMFKAVFFYLLEPLPWHTYTFFGVLAYPQMIGWYLLLAAAGWGLVIAVARHGWHGWMLALLLGGWVGIAAITSANIGSVFRQRDMITPFVIFLACLGWNAAKAASGHAAQYACAGAVSR